MDGFLNISKPSGMTSHDVVRRIRTLASGIKTGHGGTLDPDAAGVLPLLIGKGTRLSSFILELPKMYRAELQLGVATDTEDSSGKIVERKTVPDLTEQDLLKVFKLFQGEIQQVPPMYSSIKQKGKKLYQYARAGMDVERAPRKVIIYSLQIIEFYPPSRILFEVKCSKGTYIRTLCSQIGNHLECGGHMSFLLRKQVGPFTLEEAHPLEDFGDSPGRHRIREFLLPMDYLFQEEEKLFLDEAEVKDLCLGRFLTYASLQERHGEELPAPVDETMLPVYTKTNVFTLLARWKEDAEGRYFLKPEKVLKTL